MLAQHIDPSDLAASGWGVIFPQELDPGVKDALRELLERRREEATRYFEHFYRELQYHPGESAARFVGRHGAGPGPANPDKIPYYLLIVGDPQAIPFRFQYQLDIQYAVGRLFFETPQEYAHYATGVIRAENRRVPRHRVATFFGVQNPDDPLTSHLTKELISPIAENIRTESNGWEIRVELGDEASEDRLSAILGGQETPNLFLGVGSTEKISDGADLSGSIIICPACGGAGNFSDHQQESLEPVVPRPRVASLPQRLLGHPNGGALAFLGILHSYRNQLPESAISMVLPALDGVVKSLLRGERLGYAVEYLNQSYAEISVHLGNLLMDQEGSESYQEVLAETKELNRALSILVLGDPAVRCSETAGHRGPSRAKPKIQGRPPSPFVSRVRIQHYKSIVACDVAMGPLTILVGPNGSGKSNFLDALTLVTEALNTSLERALDSRGGIRTVRHRSSEDSGLIEIEIGFHLSPESHGRYTLVLDEAEDNGPRVRREECALFSGQPPSTLGPKAYYRVENGQVFMGNGSKAPVATTDRLYLVRASSESAFRPVFEALSRMAFYNIHPDRIDRLAQPDRGTVLAPDARNLVSVMRHLQAEAPETRERIETYLQVVLPGLKRVETRSLDDFETLDFFLQVAGRLRRFPITSMSDGTLGALATLVSVLQPAIDPTSLPTLVGIEEPEKALHPAAAGALADSFVEASQTVQVIVTTHSPDLLDHDAITARDVVAVVADRGVTRIGGLDEFGRSALEDRLCTAGELLRQNQLRPEEADP